MLNSSRTRIVAYLPIIIALAVIAGMMLGSRLMRVSQVTQETPAVFFAPRFDKTSDVMLYILEDYVNPVSKLDLEKEAVLGMLKSLDPHSQYIPREDFDEVVDPLLGAFEGIGIQFRMERDSCTVIHTIPGGPSEKAGVIAGDRIIIINDSTVAGVGIRDRDIVRKLRGSKGSQVNVSVYRRGFRDLITFTITRDVIPTYSVDVAWMADEETGYIRLSKFSATTHQELVEAIRNLKNQGMQRLIFDLRGNSGGILQAAISVADEFLDKNRLIVYTEGHNRPRQYSFATEQGGFTTPPLVVLIDESSASASEIIAGAIQDNDRGIVIGRRSFGKGLVQEQMNLRDGSAIRLTVARYYTPTGRSIQKPYENGDDEYFMEFYRRILSGELTSPDSIHFNDTLRFTTPAGRIVFGGGGIMPDVFVAADSDPLLQYYFTVMNKGLIHRFAFDYTDANRERLTRIGDAAQFAKQFNVTDAMIAEFVNFATESGVKTDIRITEASKKEIAHQIKAFIARNLYGEVGFFPIFLQTDLTFQTALEKIRQWPLGEPVPLSLIEQKQNR